MPFTPNESSVDTYLTLLQNIISRMANNSAGCKTWCVTITAAIIVLVYDNEKPEAIIAAYLPVMVLWFMDAYYLMMEREFRRIYNTFIESLRDMDPIQSDIFKIQLQAGMFKSFGQVIATMFSLPSVLPFYGAILLVLLGMHGKLPSITMTQ